MMCGSWMPLPSIPYYEGFGFTVIDQGDAPGGGRHLWFMRREP